MSVRGAWCVCAADGPFGFVWRASASYLLRGPSVQYGGQVQVRRSEVGRLVGWEKREREGRGRSLL